MEGLGNLKTVPLILPYLRNVKKLYILPCLKNCCDGSGPNPLVRHFGAGREGVDCPGGAYGHCRRRHKVFYPARSI